MKPNHGLYPHRIDREPREKIALDLWFSPAFESTLPWLVGKGERLADPSDRDWIIANTVIQWLGSNVGQAFLRDLRERIERAERDGE